MVVSECAYVSALQFPPRYNNILYFYTHKTSLQIAHNQTIVVMISRCTRVSHNDARAPIGCIIVKARQCLPKFSSQVMYIVQVTSRSQSHVGIGARVLRQWYNMIAIYSTA